MFDSKDYSFKLDPTVPKPTEPLATPLFASDGPQNSVVVTFSDGSHEVRRGGTRTWRNNNPGNFRLTPLAQRHGAIGEAGGFAVFGSLVDGEGALQGMLQGGTYGALTLDQAVARFAPPSENDTAAYQTFLRNKVGTPGTTRLDSLNAEKIQRMVNGIEQYEGWREGTVSWTP
jgi:hypothetical protein